MKDEWWTVSRFKLAHLSDLHFGRIAHPGIVDAIVDEVNRFEVDLVVVSGDLTQRARNAEFEAASAMLEAIRVPTLVVPGNHDVYPWWKPIRRLLNPLGPYRQHVSDEPAPTFKGYGVAVLGLNSAYGRTIKGGRIGGDAREAISTFFAGMESTVFKVIVVHHHLSQIQDLFPHDIVRNATETLNRAANVGVDLILCGHLHISHIEPVEIIPSKHRLVIASAGTATSSRGRRQHRETNFYNVVSIAPDAFTIEERRYDVEKDQFVSEFETQFQREIEAA